MWVDISAEFKLLNSIYVRMLHETAIVKMNPDTTWNIIGIIEMKSERNVSLAFCSFFALLLYLLIDAYNQYLPTADKISYVVAGICLISLLIHQIRNAWLISVKSKSDKR